MAIKIEDFNPELHEIVKSEDIKTLLNCNRDLEEIIRKYQAVWGYIDELTSSSGDINLFTAGPIIAKLVKDSSFKQKIKELSDIPKI